MGDGFDILLRAAKEAENIRGTDYLRAKARFPRKIEGLGQITRNLQMAVDFAGAELAVLNLNGFEIEAVLTAILNGLIPPPYKMESDQ